MGGAGIQITWEAVWVLESDSSDGEGQRGPYHFVCRERDAFQSLKNLKGIGRWCARRWRSPSEVADKGSLRPGAGIQITWEAVWVLESDSSDGEGQRGPYHFVCREHDAFQSLKNLKGIGRWCARR